MLADLNGKGAHGVAAEINAAGGKAIAAQVDIIDGASTKAVADAAVEAFGGIDILVNNAALMVEIAATSMMEADRGWFDKSMGVNVWGAINYAQDLIP